MRNYTSLLLLLLLGLLFSTNLDAKKKKYPNGDYYEGKWKRGTPNGLGKMIFANGNIYEGQWVNGVANGRGIQKYANGDVYDGDWLNGLAHGKGIQKYANGNVYDGDWMQGTISGNGKMIYKYGNIYDGEWRAGLIHGAGKMVYKNGDIYTGQWRNDVPNGNGLFTDHLGSKFEGYFVNGKYQKGKLVFANSDWYEGEWKDGFFYNGNVKGRIHIENRFDGYFVGNWINGICYNGKGKGIVKMKDKFEGEFDGEWKGGDLYNGKGKGIINVENKMKGEFDGEWKKGTFYNGKWRGYMKVNDYYDGEWKDGSFIGECKIRPKGSNLILFDGKMLCDSIMNGELLYTKSVRYNGELLKYKKNGSGVLELENSTIIINGEWSNDHLLFGDGRLKVNGVDYLFTIQSDKIELKNDEKQVFFSQLIDFHNIENHEDMVSKIKGFLYSKIFEFHRKYLIGHIFQKDKLDSSHLPELGLLDLFGASCIKVCITIEFLDEKYVKYTFKAYPHITNNSQMNRGYLIQQTQLAAGLCRESTEKYTYTNGMITIDKKTYCLNKNGLYEERNKIALPKIK